MIATDISALFEVERGELVVDTGLTYDGITPVRVRATKREGRYEVSDDGAAVTAAGIDRSGFTFADTIDLGEYCANVSRQGVVWLPAFDRQNPEWRSMLPGLVAKGSIALYEALLELDE